MVAARVNSFKLTAEQLFVTQAAVSQQIKLLEEFFGLSLFNRDSKSTSLNDKGKLLLPYIEQAFAQINQGVIAVNQKSPNNILSITATHSFTSLFLGSRIGTFQQLNNEFSVQFAPSNTLSTFENSQIDIGIRRGKGVYPGLESKLLYDDSVMLVASPLYLEKCNIDVKSTSLSELLTLPLLEDISFDIAGAIDHCCKQAGVDRKELNSILKTTDAVPIIQSVLAGQGIAFVSKLLALSYIKDGLLINPLDYLYHTPINLYLVAPKHHFNWDKVRKFEEWLRQEVKQIDSLV